MEGLVVLLCLVWLIPSLLVAYSGSNKQLGYWGVFWLSIFLSPLVGLICGLASSVKPKPLHPEPESELTKQYKRDHPEWY